MSEQMQHEIKTGEKVISFTEPERMTFERFRDDVAAVVMATEQLSSFLRRIEQGDVNMVGIGNKAVQATKEINELLRNALDLFYNILRKTKTTVDGEVLDRPLFDSMFDLSESETGQALFTAINDFVEKHEPNGKEVKN